ncbi:unnamed protein product [Paramecium pentaurelia]|uniref:Uncharacterized protein n=1 Tax=Paramecium pentaurelia TaxID=43138 RepID=A0A8S1T3A7_9CILI|nr:unnamed protein product [Paramecium pentaurelia]
MLSNQDQQINFEQEYILKFITEDGIETLIRINDNIRNRLGSINNIGNENLIFEMTAITQYKKSVYENLQKYIDAHKSDTQKENTSKKLPLFSNRLQDMIEERDYNIVKSLGKKDLFDLTHLAEFLSYQDLVDLLLKVITFHLAGKNNYKIEEWLELE